MNKIGIELPKISNYGNYSSDNYGVHCLTFSDDRAKYWFSYETLIAFRCSGGFFIRKNDWATTTGKHLNWIDKDKSKRINSEEFEKAYKKYIIKK